MQSNAGVPQLRRSAASSITGGSAKARTGASAIPGMVTPSGAHRREFHFRPDIKVRHMNPDARSRTPTVPPPHGFLPDRFAKFPVHETKKPIAANRPYFP